MNNTSATRDRVILFTLVDLFVQVIFLGVFLLALEADINKNKLQALPELVKDAIEAAGVQNITKLMEVVSKLIPIEELHRVITILDALTKAPLTDWEAVFNEIKAGNIPPDKLIKIIHQYLNLSSDAREQLLTYLNQLTKLSKENQVQSLKIAGENIIPTCYDKKLIFEITSEVDSFVIKVLNKEIGSKINQDFNDSSKGFNVSTSDAPTILTTDQFKIFGKFISQDHKDCRVRVNEKSSTDSRASYLLIANFFRPIATNK